MKLLTTASALAFALSCTPAPETMDNVKTDEPTPSIKFCEFEMGAPAPEGLAPIRRREIYTEGGDEMLLDYLACNDSVPVTIALDDGIHVTRLWIEGEDQCFEQKFCTGDSYGDLIDRFPNAETHLSRVEGDYFGVLIESGLTAIFSPDGLDDLCFEDRSACLAELRLRPVVQIYLHRLPSA